ncbi:sulfite exporter TauE/SafE family protein 4 [Andrographis paniculata]|uniref:sulfite exporter TauE/SafE family protein 4 n=1 Tax=Andrographis paniculata TaxID=175694 RepID=UPI0021E8D2C7|nr:sulfite exporter TauE/SafE family protein 4 [Andrographis paniculata]
MASKALLVYMLVGFSLAVVSVHFVDNYARRDSTKPSLLLFSRTSGLEQNNGSDDKVWPELKFSWKVVCATVIGFLGSACGTVGGVGGGGIFVPMLVLIVGFDTKSAAAISKCMIMGASASSVWYNLRVPHPCREVPIIDYDLALLFQPMLMLGITIGVALSVVFPYWLITILIIILFMGTSTRSFVKASEMWKEESMLKNAMEDKRTFVNSRGELLIDTEYDPLVPRQEKTPMQIMKDNLNIKRLLVLLLVWVCFLLLQVTKNYTAACTTIYWVLTLAEVPVALAVFGYEFVKLYRESKKRRMEGNQELICEAAIQWTATNLVFCGLCGILGGSVGGLLGSGGGFILGPLLLEIGVIPQVASATATFVMMFSSSLSVVEFYLHKRFPIPYAVYLMCVSVLAGFWGQYFIRKLIAILKRASIIVFVLAGVIFASALTMGVVGIERSIKMIHNHEFMGFLDFCSNQ